MTEKGFRPGQKQKVLDKIKESLTPEEARRIDATREFDTLEEGTFIYDLALHNDDLRMAMRDEMTQIDKMLHNISLLNNSIERCNSELESGVIKQKLDNDLIMTEKELRTHVRHEEWLKLNEVRAIARAVQKIRSYVGHKDIGGKDVFTVEQFDNYTLNIRGALKELGHEIFD